MMPPQWLARPLLLPNAHDAIQSPAWMIDTES
jgi:hypothetical protein